MNRLLAILLLFCASARATDVQFNFQNILHSAGPVSNRVFKLVPVSSPIAEGGIIVLREPIFTNSFTGIIIVSNMSPQIYDCTIITPITPTTFRITVPDTNVTVNASTIMTATATPSLTYTTTAADSRFALASGLLSGNTLWVDGLNGSDSSGRTNDFSKKFRTIGAAKTNAIAGDTIIVLPYAYNEHNLMKSGIQIHFLPGVNVSWTVPTNTDTGYGIFDDRAPGASGVFTVTGAGEFQFRNSNPTCAGAFGAIVITSASSRVNISGKRVIVSTRTTGFINAIYVSNCQPSFFDFDELTDTFELWSDLDPDPSFQQSSANGVYWAAGDIHIHARKNRFTSGYCIWPDEPAVGATNSLWYRGDTLYTTNITAVYGRSSSSGFRTWVEALEIMGASAINLSGPGKFYITAQKIFSVPGGNYTVITSTSETWITAQKVSGGDGSPAWVYKPANSGFVVSPMHLTVQQYEDTGTGVNPGILNASTNSLFIHGGYMKANASGGDIVKHAGTGKTYLEHVLVDGSLLGASAYPVTVSSNGLVLDAATILAGASAETVHTNGLGATLIEVYADPFASKPISPTLIVSNGLFRTAGDTNAWRGTNVNGSVGDVLTKGPRGLFFATPSAGGAPTLNTNQFDSSSSVTNIRAGVLLTNVQATVTAGTTNDPLTIRDVTGAAVANFQTNGILNLKGSPAQYTLWVQGSDGTNFVNVTSSETSILGSGGRGSPTIPAGRLKQFDIITFKGGGKYWSSAATPNTTFYFKLGSTVVGQRNFTTLTSRAGAAWQADITMRVATNGVAGTGAISCEGFLTIEGSSPFGVTNVMTLLDTTPSLAFDMTGTNTTTTMQFQSQNARLEILP